MKNIYLSQEEIKLVNELKTYQLLNNAYYYYLNNTNGNMNVSRELAKSKIIRNIVLGRKLKDMPHQTNKNVYLYGGLMVHVNYFEKNICYLKNHRDNGDVNLVIKDEVFMGKKKELESLLGIE